MRIIEEDIEFEEFIMSGEAMIAVPLEVFERNGEKTVCVYSRFRCIAEEYAARFEDAPFSDAAKAFLRERLEDPMKKAGYTYSEKDSPLIIRYTVDRKKMASAPQIDAEIVKISTNDEFERYYNNATRDVELDDNDENDVVFAAVKDDCIVSFAGVNDITDDGCLDLNVETAVNERRKNYALSVVLKLADYLTEKGESVSYRCRESNVSSIKVAEKAGFVKDSVSFGFVCFAGE